MLMRILESSGMFHGGSAPLKRLKTTGLHTWAPRRHINKGLSYSTVPEMNLRHAIGLPFLLSLHSFIGYS